MSRHDGPDTLVTVVAGNALAFTFCLPFAWPLTGIGAADGVALAWLGVFQIGLAYFSLTSGMKRVPALETSLLLLLEPVLNPAWAWWFQGERPSEWALVGAAIILAATVTRTLAVSTIPQARSS
jgi:drug/metabolite transporter (DMT)-like permease